MFLSTASYLTPLTPHVERDFERHLGETQDGNKPHFGLISSPTRFTWFDNLQCKETMKSCHLQGDISKKPDFS